MYWCIKRRLLLKVEEFYGAMHHSDCGAYANIHILKDNEQYIFKIPEFKESSCFEIAHDKRLVSLFFPSDETIKWKNSEHTYNKDFTPHLYQD